MRTVNKLATSIDIDLSNAIKSRFEQKERKDELMFEDRSKFVRDHWDNPLVKTVTHIQEANTFE